MKKALVLLCVCMSGILIMNAQNGQSVETGQPVQNNQSEKTLPFSLFHLGVAFPNGDFSDEAAIGFNVGYKYYNPFAVENLSMVFGVDVFYNDLNSDEKDRLEKYYGSSYDVSFVKYLNIPLTIGLNYTLPVSDKIGILGEFGLGLNCSMLTSDKIEKKNSDYTAKSKYSPGFGFCYGFEGGLLFQEKYTLSVRFNQLGSYKYKYTNTYSDGRDKEKGKTSRIPVSNITLGFGIIF